ncbi:MAG: lipoprotein ABC transporter ATP-binding protein [Flavobacteriales bacterium BRH_c54]|nr:MAG: lipoprotein ABC transporter ATP-binding protein [Flavobacteriales bacterium BRH_c54]
MIVIENLHKSYGDLKVLKGVDLSIKKGEIVSIVGSSGAGKSTLLHLMGTLDRADEGKIIINDENTSVLSDKKLSTFRNKHIGFVFQFHHLLPEFTALENVCIPAFINHTPKAEAEKKAIELLDLLGLTARIHHKPSELSGGEQQRVAVCRALINSPAVVLADEPSGNLDSVAAKELHQLFFDLRAKTNQTFVIVTHNEELANMADRKLVMKDGKISV